MNEPDDPGGGSTPQVSSFVTVSYDGERMDAEGSHPDTDSSINLNNSSATNATKRKRSYARKCKHCNKGKRKAHKSSIIGITDCQCDISDSEQPPSMDSIQSSGYSMSAPSTSNTQTVRDSRPTLGRLKYQASDVAPYNVHILKDASSTGENCNIHPVSFGNFLKKNNFKNIIDGSLKKIGRNRISISFSKFEDANSFVESDILQSKNYKAFIPMFTVTRMGVVRGVPVDWTDDEIINNTSVPIGCGKIIKVRRLKRKIITNIQVEFVPIETVVLTFDGQVLPKRVYICYNSLPVDLYIYPTIQCFNCCRYGHIKSQCRSTPKCYKCGQSHSGDTCSVEEESVSCCLCSGSHYATSKKCPEYTRQRTIKETMAKSCISYAEAVKLHPPISKSYADVLLSVPSYSNKTTPTFIPNNSIEVANNKISSYKKTVFRRPSSPTPRGKGYDRAAHEAIIKDYNTPITKSGCLLVNSNAPDNSFSNLSMKELLLVLLNSLSQSNVITLPSHAAQSNKEFIRPRYTENGEGDSMELPQY